MSVHFSNTSPALETFDRSFTPVPSSTKTRIAKLIKENTNALDPRNTDIRIEQFKHRLNSAVPQNPEIASLSTASPTHFERPTSTTPLLNPIK